MIWLDTALLLLLAATILYAWRLNKKLGSFRNAKQEFIDIITEFNKAVATAESNLLKLQNLTNETEHDFKERMDKARFLANDLSFLIHKGSGVADKLERMIINNPNITNDNSSQVTPEMVRKYREETNLAKQQAMENVLSQIANKKSEVIGSKANSKQEVKVTENPKPTKRFFETLRVSPRIGS